MNIETMLDCLIVSITGKNLCKQMLTKGLNILTQSDVISLQRVPCKNI